MVSHLTEYFAEWENIRARVVRPDVQCIDGVIHVIDHVLVQRREISVSGSSRIILDAVLLAAVTLMAILWNDRLWIGHVSNPLPFSPVLILSLI